ncbi:MAG: AMP-binding protein, partial [Acidimicrobiales bacterium]
MHRLVALELEAGPKFVAELRRAWDDGDAVWPVDMRLPRLARRRLFEALRPGVVVEEGGERRPLPGGGAPVEEGDALIVATSGSTGEPKGAVLTHAAVRASALATSARLGARSGSDRWWCCLPLCHVGGLSVVTRALVSDVACDVTQRFTPGGAEEALRGGATLV